MPSTYSSNLRLELQATGENTGTWGTLANTVFNLIDDAVAGVQDITLVDANYTLSTNNGTDDESRAMVLNVIGSATATRDINLPAYSKVYIIYNNLASGTSNIRAAIGGTYVTIPYGFVKTVWTDGTSCFDATNLVTERWQDWSGSLATAGSSNTYTLTTNRSIGSLADGEKVHVVANHSCTGASTLNVDSLGAKAIRVFKQGAESATASGDIIANGHYILQYDASANSAAGAWILLNPTNAYDASNVAITGGSITGITDLAVADGGTGASSAAAAATNLGLGTGDSPQFTAVNIGHATDTTLTRVSAGLAAIEGDTIALLTATQTLTNKTLSAAVASGTWTVSGTWTLPAITLGGAITGGDQTVSSINLKDYGEVTNALGDLGGGTDDIDLTLGNVVTATVSTATQTLTFSNPTASDEGCSFTLILTNGGSQTVNWPASVDWAGGVAPTLTAAGVDILEFLTVDGGTTWYGFAAGLDMQ